MVRQAKMEGVAVTCEAAPHHFSLTDEALETYDPNLKMNPPLRTERDRLAIIEGLKDGTIDVIASDHAPHSIEEKELEFEAAPFGITGLETMLGLALVQLVDTNALSLAKVVEKMTIAPAKILGIPEPTIEKGAPANLTIFNPGKSWKYDVTKTMSKSGNSPFHGWELKGKVFGVYNKGLWWQA